MFVNRRNRKDAVRALEQAGDDMKQKGVSLATFSSSSPLMLLPELAASQSLTFDKVSLWVFPEGTRSMSAESTLLPFKKGAFHLAVQAQVPIIAVVCENYWRLFDGRTRMDSGKLRIKGTSSLISGGVA